MQAIVINKTGGAGVLKFTKLPDPKPKKDEVVVRNTAIGVNFFDISFRRGQYKTAKMPMILGMEGCGFIESIGSNVADYKVGDRVAYATIPNGAYAEKQAINKHYLLTPPKNLSDIQIAGTITKGLMAHTLLHRVYIASRAQRILVHSAAGGVGHILCQMAKKIGLEIIGTVGDDKKIPFAKSFSCSK